MRYQPASGNPMARRCQEGTRALALAVKQVYPELESLTAVYGCYNRRRIAGSASWSLHAEGRAFDVGVTSRRKQLGWALSCDLVAERQTYGIQRVIWDAHIWSIEKPADWRKLSSGDKHLDHVHAEQYWDAAGRTSSTQGLYEAKLRAGRAKAGH